MFIHFLSMTQQLLVGQNLLTIEPSRSLSLIHMTLGSISLDQWSARCSDVYLTTRNTHKRQNFRKPTAEPRLWSCGHWDWQLHILVYIYMYNLHKYFYYIQFYFTLTQQLLGHLTVEVSRSNTIKHTSGSTPLNEWYARIRGPYLHNKHKRRTSMLAAGFDPPTQHQKSSSCYLHLKPHNHEDRLLYSTHPT
jgi:hypothetical protein